MKNIDTQRFLKIKRGKSIVELDIKLTLRQN